MYQTEVFKHMARKMQQFVGLDRRYDVDSEKSIDVGALATFPYQYPRKDTIINIDTDEFTAVCPFSGLPDFATIRINYIPRKHILELRSLKYYLQSYRNVGIYQEHAVNRILNDLVACCKPKWLQVAPSRLKPGVKSITVFSPARVNVIEPLPPLPAGSYSIDH